MQINYKKAVFKNFANTLRALPIDCFWNSIYCITQKIYISKYVCKTEKFWQPATFLKVLLLTGIFLPYS